MCPSMRHRAYFMSLRAALMFDLRLQRRGYTTMFKPKPEKMGYVVEWLPKQ